LLASGTCALIALAGSAIAGQHDALITKHASTNGVPESLVRRVIYIESKGNPRVISKGNFGLMQIRLGTARSMGYGGTAEGLLDADTNMTYAVKYLATAYRAAGCSEERAIAYYQRGFYKRPVSNCGPRRAPAVVQVAAKEPAPAAEAKVQQLTAAERIAAPFDALRPKIVQVQTIVRPKTFAVAVQTAQPSSVQSPSVQSPSAQPSTPVQSASLQVATAPTAPAAETRSTDAMLPPSPPLPRPAQRPDAAAPQTVAKAPDVEQAWPPALTPEQPAVVMLPMPKPRPAKAPKVFAKLDASSQDATKQDATKQDAVSSDVATATEQAAPDATQPATLMLPMPKPRPAKAPKAFARLDASSQDATKPDSVSSDVATTEQAAPDATQPAALMLPMPKSRPARAPKALARLDVTGQDTATKQDAATKQDTAASEGAATSEQAPAEASQAAETPAMQQMAKLDPQAVPLPQPRPEIEENPEREGKSARRASHRHVHYRRRQPETPPLIAFLQKLTTPAQPTRRRR
jgi:hypothetical protein